MFGEYLNGDAWANRPHQSWTTLVSFSLQVVAVAAFLLLPLLSIQGLPPLQWTAALVAPAPPPGRAPAVRQQSRMTATSNMIGRDLMMPNRIPHEIANLNETEVPPPLEFSGGPGVPGSTGSVGARNFVWDGLGAGTSSMPILSPPPSVQHVRVSHMMEGNLIHRVQPVYPPLARQARIQGTVALRAIISREGRIENLQVLSGHPMLVPAAIDAVRQWRYQPYILNGQPIEVETQITVNFSLSGG
jgi:periplasmic protein TonB